LTPFLNDRIGGHVHRNNVVDTILFEAVQPLPERACTSQSDQQ
jgi:hypothetical protein